MSELLNVLHQNIQLHQLQFINEKMIKEFLSFLPVK